MTVEASGVIGSERSRRVVLSVNDAFPDYGGPVISPLDMAQTGRANCFGRLATIGSGLISEGLPEDNIQWFINLGHGHFYDRRRGREWFGHVELVVDDQKQFVIDALFYAFFADINTIDWRPDDAMRPLFAIDEPKRLSGVTGDFMEIDGLRIVQELPEILAMGHYFAIHSFNEGIETYQDMHSWYRRQKLVWTAQDYTDLYHSLPAVA